LTGKLNLQSRQAPVEGKSKFYKEILMMQIYEIILRPA